MHLLGFFTVLLSLLALPLNVFSLTDGLTDVVTWDSNSLMVSGKRVYILAAEFHYQRLPVPELWLDVFQKFKAEGYNAISVYFFWSYHSASKGVYDFKTSGKNIQRMFDYAKEAGLYVIARPGPYCNAEANAGGLALYLSDGSGGQLRTSDETYHQAWLPWVTSVGKIIARNQISNGGNVILNQVENELQESYHIANYTLVTYMEQLETAFRAAGITIPFSSNEKGERSQSWSTDYEDVGGAVNVYGLDSYPGGLSCTNPSTGFNVVTNYYQWFQNYSFTQPEYLPEFEGGWIQGWGAAWYDNCATELSYNFPDVYYKNNIGQRVTLLSIYMSYGGTNWGNSGAPVVYTSYDYSAPLRETRQIRDKLFQIKLIGFFTRVSKDLLNTNMIGNGSGYAVNDSTVQTWELRNPTTNAGFYTLLHSRSSSTNSTTVTLNATTSGGSTVIPNINLNGRQSKIIVTDYTFGRHTLLYSSAEILTYGTFRNDILVLYLEVGQVGQLAFKKHGSKLAFKTYGVASDFAASGSSYSYTQASGTTVIQFSDGTIFYLMDRVTAYGFHAPSLTMNPNVSPSQHTFVLGPYLVRSASVQQNTVHIIGDTNATTTIEVYTGNKAVSYVTWNGVYVSVTQTPYGSLTGQIEGPESRPVTLPALTAWKTNNSLPEIQPTYDDSHWTICNKTTSLSPVAPLTLPVLFASDYNFYTGHKIYRARFPTTNPPATSINLTASNGLASGWTAWLNGHLVATVPGNASLSTTSTTFPIPTTLLTSPTNTTTPENILTVLVDYTGHDETSTAHGVENPRGLLGATLAGANFTEWRIQGTAGGAAANIDPVRGPMNEGGLYGERAGWHLPGYNTAAWDAGDPTVGIAAAGVQWYVTTFTLDFETDLDVPVGIALAATNNTAAVRVQIWVNGYQYGKFVPLIGPQSVFPVPPGVVNNQGENTLALSLWAMTDEGARLEGVELVKYGVYETGFAFDADWRYLQPRWTEARDEYA